ncbi:hypothetical protein IL992_38860 [Microbispora sp. NEAU-D428]|uniref:hypothetical protein n=1 Tax=Microbispora sitophila TaxID=2771537 RepID=UPI001867B63A|nr:hypothetical protein [Microbispora sitophila]MBE3015086.1 hypothetical protein [Microbispora sitophila]
MDSAERLALTVLCGELPELRAECARQSERHQRLLGTIEAAARARQPIIPMLGQLLGSDGSGALRTLGSALPGSGPGRAHDEAFICPDGACDRVEVPLPGGPVPVCRVTSAPMRPR